jgi:hypothetical protein
VAALEELDRHLDTVEASGSDAIKDAESLVPDPCQIGSGMTVTHGRSKTAETLADLRTTS